MSLFTIEDIRHCLEKMVKSGELPDFVATIPVSEDTRLENLALGSLELAALGMHIEEHINALIRWDIIELKTISDIMSSASLEDEEK